MRQKYIIKILDKTDPKATWLIDRIFYAKNDLEAIDIFKYHTKYSKDFAYALLKVIEQYEKINEI